jgi:hypothetical protein
MTLPAEAITALGTLRRSLAAMPTETVDDCLAVDLAVAYILRAIAEDIEGTDSHCALMDCASDIEATVQYTQDRTAEDDAARRAR